MQSKNIKWINTARALCMISVYLLHSEFYYGDAGFSYGYALTPFYVNTFFFISGYLLFKKYMKVPETICFPKKEYHKLIANVIFRLVIPTLVFSTLIYIPKMIFHGNPLSFGQYLHDVWGGTSYWFTSALSVAQILLAVLLLSQRSHMAFYVVACFGNTPPRYLPLLFSLVLSNRNGFYLIDELGRYIFEIRIPN